MHILLTPQQQQTLDSQSSCFPRVIDPRSNTAYLLIPEADYEAIREIVEEERQQQVIHAIALQNAAGSMDESP